jgi:acyl carrier protein
VSLDARLRGVIAGVFPVEPGALTDADSPQTIAEWDSVGHLNLVLAIEAEFGVQFSPDEMAELTSVGAIRERLSGASSG